MEKITIFEKCPACKGTGLYVGMAERDGAAVVCWKCKGIGKYEFIHGYEPFIEKESVPGISRVFERNPGIVIGEKLENFGGMSIEDWNAGKPFPAKSEDRQHTCPGWWHSKAVFSTCYEALGKRYVDCPHYVCKSGCWERFDKENAK